jgi:UDP-N-acetylglucosamine/UDP-N-acetylgalactosamine diphosphorylase
MGAGMTRGPQSPDMPAALAAQLTAAGQTGLCVAWKRLDAAARTALLSQLQALDWPLVAVMRARVLAAGALETANDAAGVALPDLDQAITPPCLRLRDDGNPISPAVAAARGTAALAAGRVGAILVAGGQGSRLGFDGPKGLSTIGPVSQASLFEILCGKLVAVARRHGAAVPLAIMTSSATDATTREFLARHDRFGLPEDRVLFFQQHDLPALDDTTGELLRDASGHLAMAPDGHGGMLGSLAEAGGLEWFARQGVDHIVSFQVDNPLAMPLDPEFLGYHLLTDSEFTPQVVPKTDPAERVGVVVAADGVTRIIEYSDLPAALAATRLSDGRLKFHAGSIAVHAFTRAFLERTAAQADALPLHMAHKAVPYIDAAGRQITPATPNAYKFERFLFDLMPLARAVTLVEVDPAEGFAPLKNAPGAATDTAEHVRAAMVAQARRLLGRAGVTVAEDVAVELAANLIIDADDIANLMPPGTVITQPQVIGT